MRRTAKESIVLEYLKKLSKRHIPSYAPYYFRVNWITDTIRPVFAGDAALMPNTYRYCVNTDTLSIRHRHGVWIEVTGEQKDKVLGLDAVLEYVTS
jgi:hypothetical protein